MKIAVMGAGAVGCYYGGMLARAGHDVMLIGRPQHVEAVERQGLRLETQTFDERIRVSASTQASAVQGAQLVLFCVKSTDTESGAAAIKPHLAPCDRQADREQVTDSLFALAPSHSPRSSIRSPSISMRRRR